LVGQKIKKARRAESQMRTKARHYYPPIKKCRGLTLRSLPKKKKLGTWLSSISGPSEGKKFIQVIEFGWSRYIPRNGTWRFACEIPKIANTIIGQKDLFNRIIFMEKYLVSCQVLQLPEKCNDRDPSRRTDPTRVKDMPVLHI
jgi:hypothetical protein